MMLHVPGTRALPKKHRTCDLTNFLPLESQQSQQSKRFVVGIRGAPPFLIPTNNNLPLMVYDPLVGT